MTFEAPNISVNYSGTLPRVPFLAIKEKILGKKYDLSIAFVTPQKAQSINMSQRNKDYVPNTLSFSLSKDSGEIILCKSMLQQEYREFGMTYDNYIIFILIQNSRKFRQKLRKEFWAYDNVIDEWSSMERA